MAENPEFWKARVICTKIRQMAYDLENISFVKSSGQAMSSTMHIRAHAHLLFEHCKHADKIQRHKKDKRRAKE